MSASSRANAAGLPSRLLSVGCLAALLHLVAGGAALPEPSWTATAPILEAVQGAVSVKDPSVVFYEGKFHLFHTVYVTPKKLEIHYTCAPSLADLNRSPRAKVLDGAAPQVFFHKDRWFLIQNPMNYATNRMLGPDGWESHGPLCANVPAFPPPDSHRPIDPWVICDTTTAYLFYSRDNGTLNMTSQPLAIFPSPEQWSPHFVVLDERPDRSNIFEAAHIYRSRADAQYYMQVEGLGGKTGRKLALYTAPTLQGKWTLVSNQWAIASRLTFADGNAWTDRVSHPEAIRTNCTQDIEIADINQTEWIIMGTTAQEVKATSGAGGGYGAIPWRLGLMRNRAGPLVAPAPKP